MLLQREGNRVRIDLDPIFVIAVATMDEHPDFPVGCDLDSLFGRRVAPRSTIHADARHEMRICQCVPLADFQRNETFAGTALPDSSVDAGRAVAYNA